MTVKPLTETDIRSAYLEELARIAPDIDPSTVGDDDHLQDDLGLDSMDVLNFVTALYQRLGIDVPESDYPEIATLARAVPYMARRAG
jgi:acyl carrier protein